MTTYARRLKIEKYRLSEPAKITAVIVIHRLERIYSQGTPPKMRTMAKSGTLMANSRIIWKSLLKSLPITICKLFIGVVIRTPSVRW